MKTLFTFLLVILFTSCSHDANEIVPDIPDPGQPETSSDIYKFKLTATENRGNIFHLFEFFLLNKDEKGLDVSFSELKQIYDSITWSSPAQKGRMKVFSIETGNSYSGCKLVSLWSQTFYLPGEYETYLLCYKDNQVVYSDTLKVEVVDEKDFLMYNWDEVKVSDKTSIGFNNALNDTRTLSALRLMHGDTPGIQLYLQQTIDDDNEFAELSHQFLYDYISSIYQQPVYDREADNLMEKYQELFSYKDINSVPQAIWLTPKSKIVLLMRDRDGLKQTYVYAEPQ